MNEDTVSLRKEVFRVNLVKSFNQRLLRMLPCWPIAILAPHTMEKSVTFRRLAVSQKAWWLKEYQFHIK